MVQKQNCVIWIQTVSWYTYKQMIFIKTLQKMLKQKDYNKDTTTKRKEQESQKDELGIKIMKEFTGSRAKTYSYLTDNNDEYKRAKGTKNCAIKRKLKFEDYKICFRSNSI